MIFYFLFFFVSNLNFIFVRITKHSLVQHKLRITAINLKIIEKVHVPLN